MRPEFTYVRLTIGTRANGSKAIRINAPACRHEPFQFMCSTEIGHGETIGQALDRLLSYHPGVFHATQEQ